LEVNVLERLEHEFQGLLFLVRPKHEIDETDDEARAEGPRGILEILPVVLVPGVPFFPIEAFDEARRAGCGRRRSARALREIRIASCPYRLLLRISWRGPSFGFLPMKGIVTLCA
jgi:hypothetical protein